MFQARSTHPFSAISHAKRPARRLAFGAASALIAGAILLPAQHASAASTALVAVGSASDEPVAVAAGDVGAIAIVDLTVDGVTGDICVNSSISGLSGSITGAHIHSGGVGVSGPVFVALPNTATTVSGCVVATPAQARPSSRRRTRSTSTLTPPRVPVAQCGLSSPPTPSPLH